MVATILLIRHAEHVEFGRVLTGRRDDVALSAAGLAQTATLAERLGAARIAAIYSSPRERAHCTAAALAGPHAIPVTVAPALDEVDFGDWSGRSFAELDPQPEWRRWNATRSTARAPGGESMAEAADRSLAALDRLAQDHPGATLAAVSHCDIIRGVIARCLGLSLDHILRFDVDPASVSRLAFGPGERRVMSVNERLYA